MVFKPAYTPEPLNPLEAQLLNTLLTRKLPHGFAFFGKACSFAADPWQAPFVPACVLHLEIWGGVWHALFSSTGMMGLHPVGAQIAESADLPEALRLALFELSLAPALAGLAKFFDLDKAPAILAEHKEITQEFACAVPLTLCLPDENISVSLHVPSQEYALTVLRRLGQEKRKQNPMPDLPIQVSLEAGSMCLSVQELALLKPEDILLPETFFGHKGELCLRLSPDMRIRCAVDKGRATVLDFEHHPPMATIKQEMRREKMTNAPETSASKEQQSMPETGALLHDSDAPPSANAINLDLLEVMVTFELERRLMSIAEITALTPGYTLTLATDPGGPVTIRANGKCLGYGRLVDVGGSLGVQLLSLEQEK